MSELFEETMPDTIAPCIVTSVADLEALYGQPAEAATVREVAHITPHYRAYIEAAPFCALATSGPEGLTARRAATSRASCGCTTRRP
jgi:predicted pyridoxine 5'-phosphate oxidase superfamily flavin-nucleotide-binding protein